MTSDKVEQLAEGVTLYLGDCLEVLPTLGKFDAVVTDPPYGVEYAGSVTKHGKNGSAYASFEDTVERVGSIYVPAVRMAVSKATCAVITPGNANAFLYDKPRAMGVIYYPSGANSGPWGFVCSQPLFYYGKDPYLANALGRLPSAFATTEATDRNVDHPCPKPLGTMKWLVSRVSLSGQHVLDPFMGSGTTGVAAVKLGRRFTGIEIDPGYFDIACRRISAALKEPDMFIEPPKPVKQEAFIL